MIFRNGVLGASFFCSLLAHSAQGQTGLAPIDRDLLNAIDFRAIEFSVCEDQTTCTVGEVTLTAQRREDADDGWTETDVFLYWDPLDGLGVKGGGQNDEIDFDERIVVSFSQARQVDRVWFSDLFRDEDHRYASGVTERVLGVPEDAEIAGVSFQLANAVVFNQIVSGTDPLPADPFNEYVSGGFAEDGDLLRRVIIDGERVTLVVPGENVSDFLEVVQVPLGQIDKDKADLFEGLETVQIDLSEIITDFHNARLFERGTRNFDYISEMLDTPQDLTAMQVSARSLRLGLDLSNGEFVADALYEQAVDTLVFFSPFDSSNDFSVAGLVLKPITEAAVHKLRVIE